MWIKNLLSDNKVIPLKGQILEYKKEIIENKIQALNYTMLVKIRMIRYPHQKHQIFLKGCSFVRFDDK
ncbi:hypothetical protein NCCP28_33560 [Niallia sp. NCCP-28]|nr:hypothetical protein NCCP28_33560 [Niallia sp. NCCP-28]